MRNKEATNSASGSPENFLSEASKNFPAVRHALTEISRVLKIANEAGEKIASNNPLVQLHVSAIRMTLGAKKERVSESAILDFSRTHVKVEPRPEKHP